jgi:hypothetical protein
MSQSALHNAAIELIPAVLRATVREVLKLLLADPAFDDVAAVAVVAPSCPAKPQAAATAVDPWAELKTQLRARMTAQGVDYAGLVTALAMPCRLSCGTGSARCRRSPSRHHFAAMATTLPPEPPDSPLEGACCWEEYLPGASRSSCCRASVVPGRPWCVQHCRRFQWGRTLKGRTAWMQHIG